MQHHLSTNPLRVDASEDSEIEEHILKRTHSTEFTIGTTLAGEGELATELLRFYFIS